MKSAIKLFLISLVIGCFVLQVFSGCGKQKLDVAAYNNEIQQWKERRYIRLMRDDGWLTLCGLFWLKEGENIVGSDSSNRVILPAGKTPKRVGSILLSNGKMRFESQKGVEVKCKDSLITAITVLSDEATEPTILKISTLSFYVIKRGNELGVRVKNKENPARMNFKGLEYFPVDPAWRFEARFEPYTPPKILSVPSQAGTVEQDSCPGALAFEYQGKTYRIDAVIERGSEDQLFIMFGDATNGKETYAVGRQLYTDLPDSTHKVILDFNKAYNWPCVFTEFATCPIPPRQNQLPIRVGAGEKMYSGH